MPKPQSFSPLFALALGHLDEMRRDYTIFSSGGSWKKWADHFINGKIIFLLSLI